MPQKMAIKNTNSDRSQRIVLSRITLVRSRRGELHPGFRSASPGATILSARFAGCGTESCCNLSAQGLGFSVNLSRRNC